MNPTQWIPALKQLHWTKQWLLLQIHSSQRLWVSMMHTVTHDNSREALCHLHPLANILILWSPFSADFMWANFGVLQHLGARLRHVPHCIGQEKVNVEITGAVWFGCFWYLVSIFRSRRNCFFHLYSSLLPLEIRLEKGFYLLFLVECLFSSRHIKNHGESWGDYCTTLT